MTILKIGQAHNEIGEKFFTSNLLKEKEDGIYWSDSLIFNTGNFFVSSSFSGNGTKLSPLDWNGLTIQNNSGIIISSRIKKIKADSGVFFSTSEDALSISINLSNYSSDIISISGNSITLSGGNSKLILNGSWSLQDGNAVKFTAENSSTAYLYSSDRNSEYPVLKAKSNALGADRQYLLLDIDGKIPFSAREIASSEKIGEIKVNGNNLSIRSDGLLSWTGFQILNSKNESLSSAIKSLQEGNNISFKISGENLIISSEASKIEIDSSLDSNSENPVQNKIITEELNKKISLPTGGIAGQVLGKTSSGIEWINQTASSGSAISNIQIVRPISELELYPFIEASENSDFTDSITLDPLNKIEDKNYFKVYSGEIWMDFPGEGGLGLPFDNAPLSVNTIKFSTLLQPYYIRYSWKTPDGAESNYKSTIFPSVQMPDPLEGESDEIKIESSPISTLIIQRPDSDDGIHPKIIASNKPDFSEIIVLDPLNREGRSYIKVFDGQGWIDFPEIGGLGTPFSGMPVSINMDFFESLKKPYYVRFSWLTSDGAESNYKSTIFPSVGTLGPENKEVNIETSISHLILQCPYSNEGIYPRIEASSDSNFSESIVLNCHDKNSFNYIKVFDGQGWINFPDEGGLGIPFGGMPVSINMDFFESLKKPYYVRFSWLTFDGAESNYKSTIFPSGSTFSPETYDDNLSNNSKNSFLISGESNVILSSIQYSFYDILGEGIVHFEEGNLENYSMVEIVLDTKSIVPDFPESWLVEDINSYGLKLYSIRKIRNIIYVKSSLLS